VEERREQILKVAERLFRHSGYTATSMSDIARHAGMSKRTIYEAFPTKEELFGALVTDVASFPNRDGTIDPADSPRQVIESALTEIAHYVLSERHILVSRLVIAESDLFPAIRQHYYEQGIDRCKRYLVSRIAALMDQSRIEPVDADRTADMLFGAVIATHLIAAVNYRQAPDFSEIAAKIDDAVSRFIVAPTQKR
jgi:TetR/AcrR family transcriptional regulator, regulator of autoinduction and epiphytic fitness